MNAIIVGPDRGLGAALEARGIDYTRIEGIGSGKALKEAGIEDADLLVITAVDESTTVPVAKELNPDIKAVVYSPDTVPEFVRGQLDFALDPALLEPDTVAEEII